MLSYIYKNVLKNCVYISLDSRHLCILKQKPLSENLGDDVVDRRYKSFVSIFERYGFTETQVSSLFSKSPMLLYYAERKKIEPKLEFFTKNGFSSTDLCHVLTLDPGIMGPNMTDWIIPSYEFLRSVLKDDTSVVAAVRRCTSLLKRDLGKHLRPNVELLRNYGVPDNRIAVMLRSQPRAMLQSADGFKMVVEEVKEMGFEPVKSHFIIACRVKCGLSKTMWERKWNCFKKWGWSDDEILSAFMKQPTIMAVSEKKVDRVMDFLVNKMRWEISKVACCPAVVMHSLEKWTVPRCLIIQFLLSKGLVRKEFPLSTVIVSVESRFVENYVEKFCVDFPEVLELYADLQKNNTRIYRRITRKQQFT